MEVDMNVITRESIVHDVMVGNETIVSCLISDFADGKFLYRLFTSAKYRGKGLAGDMVRWVCERYSEQPVYLSPAAFLDKPMPTSELMDWYKRIGFVDVTNELAVVDVAGVGVPVFKYFGKTDQKETSKR